MKRGRYNNVRILVIFTIMFFSLLMLSYAFGQQKARWKGKIEIEDGIKVIKNPNKPLYGEIKFELEEDLSIGNEEDENYLFFKGVDIGVDSEDNILTLDIGNCRIQKFDKSGKYHQTIGRKGQGPREFESPTKIFLDSKDNIYVNDQGRKIKVFRNNGEYVKSYNLKCTISDFYISPSEYIYAISHINDERGIILEIVKIDSNGDVIKIIADFRGLIIVQRKSGDVKGFFLGPHEYNYQLYLFSLDEEAFCYSFSSEYKIFKLDNKGHPFLIIQKEEHPHSISQKEKDFILNRAREKIGKNWPKGVLEETYQFPSHKPFFDSIMSDDKQRFYIRKTKSVLDKSGDTELDVFSKDGHYLHKAIISVVPRMINNGLIYSVEKNEDTGEIKIKRYKIKNWEQIRDEM